MTTAHERAAKNLTCTADDIAQQLVEQIRAGHVDVNRALDLLEEDEDFVVLTHPDDQRTISFDYTDGTYQVVTSRSKKTTWEYTPRTLKRLERELKAKGWVEVVI